MLKKCKYYNNHQTAVSLMIDDLSPIYISYDNGKIKPWYDWGYERFKKDSLLDYFYKNFLNKFPEVKGTIYLPLKSEDGLPKTSNSGMYIKSNSFTNKDSDFFDNLSLFFDFAFHGLQHASYRNNDVTDKYIYETENLKLINYESIKNELENFSRISNNVMSGGKFTGYHYFNEESFELIKKLGFKWWALRLSVNKKKNNSHSYIKIRSDKILDLPTNLNGNSFKRYLENSSNLKSYYYSLKKFYRKIQIENYLDYLYSNQYVITIQEHFQNQAFNGKIQTPNVFDDILSLEYIYSIIRGCDVWHVNNSELSHYIESYDFTNIKNINENTIKIEYNGCWDKMFLSFLSNKPQIIENKTKKIIKGIYKNNFWIYNNLNQGLYSYEL